MKLLVLCTLFSIALAEIPYYTSAANRDGIRSPTVGFSANPAVINSGSIDSFLGAIRSQTIFFPPVRINVAQKSQLYLPPGTEGRLTFILQNDGIGDLFIIRGFDDKSFLIQFEYPQVQLGSGQSIEVSARLRVPQYAQDVVSTLTIIVQRRADNAISRRSVYIRTRTEPGDKRAPWCTIRTITQCEGYLDESVCAQRYWYMRAEVQDIETGLLSVSTRPDGRFLGEDFIVAMNGSITVEQSISCCTTGVDVVAVDVRGNSAICRADQYANYLDAGDIAAITLGVILLIVLIVIIVLVICCCCRRKKYVTTEPMLARTEKDQAWLFSPKRAKHKDISTTVKTNNDEQ